MNDSLDINHISGRLATKTELLLSGEVNHDKKIDRRTAMQAGVGAAFAAAVSGALS